MSKCREEFERWAENYIADKVVPPKWVAWDAWQAAWNAALDKVLFETSLKAHK